MLAATACSCCYLKIKETQTAKFAIHCIVQMPAAAMAALD